ncbi:hypothetical protein CYMTET_46566 [Cymbomonas tetramitiformis]|uniref:Xrn1 N-terminal domain-containing protein n=1 Tax=Cymbomonas tetramitiformis TaxID=36881 RepID=A0AAE0BXT9_9CHLO|nr:hypothetical protein CYMTET_46566 [Cymbomonas tetramitiformis]
MGIPSFYRWLSDKYPRILQKVVLEKPPVGTGNSFDLTAPSQNGEFDNLYLDMNGIIHTCFHPDDTSQETRNEAKVFENVFVEIDTLFQIIRPRKILYLAIDGCAPRAKLNQQRSRRFRSAKEADEKKREEERLRTEMMSEGLILPPKEEAPVIDANVITPGTPFMGRLAEALRHYCDKRITEEPAWANLKVCTCCAVNS